MNSPVAWVLVFHILGFVFWTAGLLVATQVLATHTQEKSDEVRRVLSRLETKLLNGVRYSLPAPVDLIQSAGDFLVIKRWFQHVASP